MSVGSNGSRHYDLSLSADLQAEIHRLHRLSSDQGRGSQFVQALDTILKRLEKEPTKHGDPLYQLPNMRLVVYEIVVNPIIIHYGVSDEHSIVYLKSIRLLSEKTS